MKQNDSTVTISLCEVRLAFNTMYAVTQSCEYWAVLELSLRLSKKEKYMSSSWT